MLFLIFYTLNKWVKYLIFRFFLCLTFSIHVIGNNSCIRNERARDGEEIDYSQRKQSRLEKKTNERWMEITDFLRFGNLVVEEWFAELENSRMAWVQFFKLEFVNYYFALISKCLTIFPLNLRIWLPFLKDIWTVD